MTRGISPTAPGCRSPFALLARFALRNVGTQASDRLGLARKADVRARRPAAGSATRAIHAFIRPAAAIRLVLLHRDVARRRLRRRHRYWLRRCKRRNRKIGGECRPAHCRNRHHHDEIQSTHFNNPVAAATACLLLRWQSTKMAGQSSSHFDFTNRNVVALTSSPPW